jgi:tRNA (guanine-N7-)-methyltransferase
VTVPIGWSAGGGAIEWGGRGAPPPLAGPHAAWEVEIGFGKGRYLRRRAAEAPEVSLLGIERVGEYFRRLVRIAARDGLANLHLVRGEALYLLSAVLPRGFARAVHIYFPDPWPKARHERRRLLEVDTVDLVVGLLEPGGTLFFATDFMAYGSAVRATLESHPDLGVEARRQVWEGGPRTNYEAKYLREGRPIVRLEAVRRSAHGAPHPSGLRRLAVAVTSLRNSEA